MPQDQTWTEALAFSYSSQSSNTTATATMSTDAQTVFLDGMKLIQDLIAQMNSAF